MDVYKILVDILENKIETPIKRYTPYTTLKTLNLDELDGVQLVMELEKALGITLPDNLLFRADKGEELGTLKAYLSLGDITDSITHIINKDEVIDETEVIDDDETSPSDVVDTVPQPSKKLGTLPNDKKAYLMRKLNIASRNSSSFSKGTVSPNTKPAIDIEALNTEEEEAKKELKKATTNIEDLNKRLSSLAEVPYPGEKITIGAYIKDGFKTWYGLWIVIVVILFVLGIFIDSARGWTKNWFSWGLGICTVLFIIHAFTYSTEKEEWDKKETEYNKYLANKTGLENSISREKRRIQNLQTTIQKIQQTRKDGLLRSLKG